MKRSFSWFLVLTIFSVFVWQVQENQTDGNQLNTAFELWGNGKKKEAKTLLESLVSKGNQEATVALGNFLIIEEKNLKSGRELIRTAAERGSANAQMHLAGSYLGRGSADGDREGLIWLERAAVQCEPAALKLMVNSLRTGAWGQVKNEKQAAQLEKKCVVPR